MTQITAPTRSDMIFAPPQNEKTKIWVDPQLSIRSELASLLQTNGASISPDHADPDTSVVVLHPSTISVFDEYCHPVWLSMAGVFRHIKRKRSGQGENWRKKVVVTDQWPRACLAAGRYLGEEDDWGGCRKGGPVKRVVPAIEPPIDPPPSIYVHPAPPAPVPPRPAILTLDSAFSAPPRPIAIPPSGPRKIAGFPARPNTRLPVAALPATPPSAVARHVSGRSAVQADEWSPVADPPRAPRATQTTPAAEKTPRKGKAKALSIILPSNGKPINTPTSKWQAAQDPPKILEGLRFYLDGGRNGRKHTLNNITKSAGEIVAEPEIATHCLLSRVPAANAKERRELIETATKAGAWCVAYEWLESSWSAKRCVDEANFVYEGETPQTPGVVIDLEEGQEYQPTRPDSHASNADGTPSSKYIPWNQQFSPEELDVIFRQAHPISLTPGKKWSDVVKHLCKIHPGRLHTSSWKGLYRAWRDCTAHFSFASEETTYKAYTNILELYLHEIQAGRSIGEVSRIIAKRHFAEGLSIAEWEFHFGNWLRTLPPDTPDIPSQGGAALSERMRQVGRERRMTLAKIFKRDYDLSTMPRYAIAQKVAEQTGFLVAGVAQSHRQWSSRHSRWGDIPAELQPSETGPAGS